MPKEVVTKKQIEILLLLYRFRHIATRHVQHVLQQKHLQRAQDCLNLLVERKYIDRRYEGADKIAGRYAAYYLLPEGRRLLKQNPPSEITLSPKVLRNIYKDKTASAAFIQHNLSLCDTYGYLSQIYGDTLDFFTKSDLATDDYDYFPQPLPDAYFSLTSDSSGTFQDFIVQLCDDSRLFYLLKNDLKQYVAYAERMEWESATDTPLPPFLLICTTPTLQKRLTKLANKQLAQTYTTNLAIFTTTTEQLLTSSKGVEIWQSVIEPEQARVLEACR